MGRELHGTVLRATAGFFEVDTDEGVLTCKLRGRLKKVKKKTDLCVIGDRVRLTLVDDEQQGLQGVIEEVEPRRTVFSRRHPGRGGRFKEDVLVANLDQLIVVFAFRDPPFHPRMLDRFLVIAEQNGIDALVVMNKLDQVDDTQRDQALVYEGLGYPVHLVSATSGAGLGALRERLGGRISAFVGPSGAGKSSLLNALDPELALRVGETSESHGKGRHTTRVATLHPMHVDGAAGYVADTPGIRELGTWDLPESELDRCFPEMRPHLGRCGFRNCVHVHEPDCAVKAAVEAGAIRAERYDSYVRMLADEER